MNVSKKRIRQTRRLDCQARRWVGVSVCLHNRTIRLDDGNADHPGGRGRRECIDTTKNGIGLRPPFKEPLTETKGISSRHL